MTINIAKVSPTLSNLT